MGSNGIDVSNNNGKLNLTTGYGGLDFVIAKVTEGTSFVDRTYHPYYYQETAKTGALFGGYHFLHAEDQDGESEAAFCLAHIQGISNLSAGFWIDYESYGPSARDDLETIAAFTEYIKSHSGVKRVGLYANLTGMRRVCPIGVDAVVDAYWLADPTGAAETSKVMPAGYSWNIHQYEELGGVDRDYSRWSKESMAAYFKM